MKKIKNTKIFIIILTMMILISLSISSYASFNVKTTQAHLKWSSQTTKETEKTIEPIPFTVDLKSSVKRSTLNEILKASSDTLPEKYNLNDDINIKVKNQENTNSCWAFSTTSILETTIAKTKEKSMFFSPRHIEYATSKTFLDGTNTKSYKREVDSGGNVYLGFNYATSGNGPVLEEDMPFENNANKINLSEIQNKKVATKLDEYKFFPTIKKEIINNTISYNNGELGENKVTYTQEEVDAIRTLIKTHIMEYGAVSAYNYIEDTGKYYNIDKVKNGQANGYAYYCNDSSVGINHAVTIVGWDDTYSADNFDDNCKPQNDGAYIALNSWGEEVLNKGYFYISYDDAIVEQEMLGAIETEDVNYDNIYQYDELGYSYPLNLVNTTNNTECDSVYAVNVYESTPVEGKKEYLDEISISVAETSNVEIYANVESDDKTKIEKVASPGILETGYYTIKLPTPIEIKGEKFVVGAKYTNQEGVSVPTECNILANGGDSNYWDNATGEEGQSFVSIDKNNWSDVIKDIGLKQSNVCVKAFTSYVEDTDVKVESISLNKDKLEMTEGESTNLEVTFNPSDATNKNVKWLTEDTNVATIDTKGNITAVKEGKTVITAISEDGDKTAKCEVIVKKKTMSDDDIYKETLKDGKTGDTTVSNKIIPYAGNSTFIIIILIATLGIGIYAYIKIRIYKDVK